MIHQAQLSQLRQPRQLCRAVPSGAAGRLLVRCSSAHTDTPSVARRQLLQIAIASTLCTANVAPGHAIADEVSASSPPAAGGAAWKQYVSQQQQYRLSLPPRWEQTSKAGADVLFEDPERRSTSVGVTVSPVRVKDITQFGDVDAVGRKLLDSESKKESTLSVQLLRSGQRQGAGGALLYDYVYELDSTRGRKRIFNTVSITSSKLYILNGQYKCDKEGPCEGVGALAALAAVADSFDAGAASLQLP